MRLSLRAVASTLLSCSLFLILACLPGEALAQVVVTVTGTVESGTNGSTSATNPGAGKIFGGGSDLTGQSFTLTMTFDPSQGTNSFSYCSDGTLNQSSNAASNASEGPTAVLEVGGGSFR